MRVCSLCRRCYDDPVALCTEESHPPLLEIYNGGTEMVAGYRLDHLFESGVGANVYRARQITCDRSCLIKILQADQVNGQEFLREAKLAAALCHPNVVDVYEAGSLANGELFVVWEEANGQTLREFLRAAGAPRLLTSIQIARQTAEALQALHLSGLPHRALRPENIVLGADAEDHLLVRIQDPDLGRVIERATVSNRFLIDSALDSLRYFSPEQCSGHQSGLQADIYSLGIVFYEMLSGTPPFDAPKAAALIQKHREQQPPEIRIDDFELRMLVTHTLMESLNKRPERRQSSANAFARQLRHIEQLATHVSTPPPAGTLPAATARWATAAAPFSSASVVVPAPIVRVVAAAPAPVPASIIAPHAWSVTPSPDAEESLIENRLETQNALPASRLLRLKHRMRRLRLKPAPPKPVIREELPSPSFEAIEPIQVKAAPIDAPVIQMALQKSEVAACIVKPIKVGWDQPEDDIPTVEDVLEVLASEQTTGFSAFLAEEMQQVEPIQPEEFADAATKSEERLAVQYEPEEITVVTVPHTRIRIDLEGYKVQQRRAAVRNTSQVPDNFTFFPTILGDTGERRAVEPTAQDSFLSAYYGPMRTDFSIPYRSLMIGGGFLALIALFLFGGGLLRSARNSGQGDTVAAKTVSPQTSLSQVVQTKAVVPLKQIAPKNFDKPLPKDEQVAEQWKSATGSPQLSNIRSQTPTPAARRNAGKAPLSSTLVIFSDNGKIKMRTEPAKSSADKKTFSVPNKTEGATRPRIVNVKKGEARP